MVSIVGKIYFNKLDGFCISAKNAKFHFWKIRKYEGLWKFCSDGQERMEWFRKSFSKILYKYNRLSIFNVELFLVSQVKTMFKQHVREKFLEITKVFGLLRKKKNISFYQRVAGIPGTLLHLEVRLCTNRYVFLCALLASHLDPFIFNIPLWKKLSWPQVFVVHKLFK